MKHAAPQKIIVDQALSASRLVIRGQSLDVRAFERRLARITQPTNILEVIQLVMKESIQQTNEDMKYFLQKLDMFNEMAEQLSDYLNELSKASKKVPKEKGSKSCSSGKTNECADKVDRAAAKVEAAIAKLESTRRRKPEVQLLLRKVKNHRKLTAAIRHRYIEAIRHGRR
jgi:hypothetical protein